MLLIEQQSDTIASTQQVLNIEQAGGLDLVVM